MGWLLLSLTDPMGPPGPVLEAVLSAGGEVSSTPYSVLRRLVSTLGARFAWRVIAF
mgnify:FL=1